jgi:hypothetical protein
MVEDLGRDVVVALLLVPHVDEAVIDPHFEFVGRRILATLVLVELFQALESYDTVSGDTPTHGSFERRTIHELLIFHLFLELGILPLHIVRQDMKACTPIVGLDGELAVLVLHGEVAPDGP